ncbi:MAG: transposase family protein [Coleofasciculus sp. G3-WIS-01]
MHLIKDLPWGETEIFLKINRRQFKCTHCQKPFSEELNFELRTTNKTANRDKLNQRASRVTTVELS